MRGARPSSGSYGLEFRVFLFHPMNSVHIGERLTQLRAMMAAESLVPGAWPHTHLAREAGVSLAALTRLESTGRASTEVLTALLHFCGRMVR